MEPIILTPKVEQRHSEDIEDIISKPPRWLLRWGITVFLGVLVMIFSLSALIRYPDIIKSRLRVSSNDVPKPVVAKLSGKLEEILINENEEVSLGQSLAYLESTANHEDVLELLQALENLKKYVSANRVSIFTASSNWELGELQGFYQSFFQTYLVYQASADNGIHLITKAFIKKELKNILSQKDQLLARKKYEEEEYALAVQEFEMHKKLAEAKVEAKMELKRAEGKFLASKHPLQQTELALILNDKEYTSKVMDLMKLDNQIKEEQTIFTQALNSLISEIENWRNKYILEASSAGVVSFAGVIHEKQILSAGQEVFYINPGQTSFFGEMQIPQYNMGKIKVGQEVLIKLQSYPYEEYGLLKGSISSISEVPYKDSIFLSRVKIDESDLVNMKKKISLKNGMNADAEIVTEDGSLLHRFSRTIFKTLD